MIHLAGFPAGRPANRATLAAMAEVPPQFLSKVLQLLTRAHLIHSRRGVQGGFELSKPRDQITVLQIVEAVEGPICLNVCLSGTGRCSRSWWCTAHGVFRDAQAAMVDVLSRATLEQLASDPSARLETSPTLQALEGGPAWS